MSELTILEAMNKDLQLMLKREDKRDMQDEQLFPEHREMIEEIIERLEEIIYWEPTDADLNNAYLGHTSNERYENAWNQHRLLHS